MHHTQATPTPASQRQKILQYVTICSRDMVEFDTHAVKDLFSGHHDFEWVKQWVGSREL